MTQNSNINISLYAQTNIGMVRHGNEDNFLVVDLSSSDTWTVENANSPPQRLLGFNQGHYGSVIAVSDGMGGALAGEVASQLAVSSVRDRMLQFQATPSFSHFAFPERLRLAVEQANYIIHSESQNNVEYTGMGATFTAAGIEGHMAYFAQVGDSRCYLVRNNKISQVTKDQSLVSQLVEAGHITEEEAEQHTYKNVILQALGAQPRVNVIVDRISLKQGDTLLLCSDGLSGKVKGIEMLKIIQDSNGDLQASCDALIKLANDRGGEDNITVLIAKVDGEGLESPVPEDPSKGEFVIRDSSLPDEVDPSQLIFGDDETLKPEEDVVAKVRERDRVDVVETQEVQATMLNMQAITPQMLAQMAMEAPSAEPTSDEPAAIQPSAASSNNSSASSNSSASAQESEEVEYAGSSSRTLTTIVVIVLLIALAVFAVFYIRSQRGAAPEPATNTGKVLVISDISKC
ncbi:MAG: serine/threonine-protein phosphatase [Blastocatellia bacterium]|nr:serine/threonine-protein phosphatase [Blastocatellia bacterium]MBL8195521.1 serine/threonine-protein phosphatase [Blastocatellia bacterium]MBN8725585.1 serine/threonine-protein phosphatase [Acidobacteriota bacterium]